MEILFAKTCYYKNQNEVEFNALSPYQRNVTNPEIKFAIHKSLSTNVILDSRYIRDIRIFK